jgi:hypothetical protein
MGDGYGLIWSQARPAYDSKRVIYAASGKPLAFKAAAPYFEALIKVQLMAHWLATYLVDGRGLAA